MRVLIADSDEQFMELLQSYLWDMGHEVEYATTGMACIAILRDYAPDVLVLDDELLWGGCAGVLAEMQEDPFLADTPVILTSDSGDKFPSLNPNVTALLRKPFRLTDLARQIASIRRRQNLASPAAQQA